jgi:hypothetical protein
MVMRFLVSATLASAMVLAFVASIFADGRPVPRDGACPSGTHGSGDWCVPDDRGTTGIQNPTGH